MSIRNWLWEIRFLLEYLVCWPVVALFRRLSEERSRALARGLSRVAYRVLTWERCWCLKNLELVFGENLAPGQRTRLGMRACENYMLTLMESLRWTPEWMKDHVIDEGGQEACEVARKYREKGLGAINISAHMGNFELLPAWVYYHGWGGAVMYRPQLNWRIDRLILGNRVKYMQGRPLVKQGLFGLLGFMYTLREGQGVGLLIDVDTLQGGVFVDFLGFQASCPAAPAALALATGAPVILNVSIRQPDGRHRLIFHPPFPLIRTGNRDHDIRANTQQYLRALEPYILAHPEQYNWQYPHWRFRPDQSRWTWDMPYEQLAAERTSPPRRLSPLPQDLLSRARAAA